MILKLKSPILLFLRLFVNIPAIFILIKTKDTGNKQYEGEGWFLRSTFQA